MNTVYEKLELNIILKKAASFASSALSVDAVVSSKPVNDYREAAEQLSLTSQAVSLIDKYRHSGVYAFSDCTEIIRKAKTGACLTMGELLKVASLLSAARKTRGSFTVPTPEFDKINDIAYSIRFDESLEKEIDGIILGESEISDNASDKLRELRIKLRHAQSKLTSKLNSYTKNNSFSKYLQDNLVTMRNGRYVLPVKNECRGEVKGLLHDLSSSGATAFIEPFEVVEMNNEIIHLKTEENNEIERILIVLSSKVMDEADNILFSQDRLVELDVIFAKAKYSIDIDGILPELSFGGDVVLKGARHPLLNKNTVVPINLEITDSKPILLISGPNTGGKTVSIKTVGLFSLMLSSGIMVPCKEGSKMAIFDNIFCDIGDSQDITENLSTFSSHINNLINITNSFTNDSLILLDEIGSSTNPEEGAALAIGIIEYISRTKAKAIITTHYSQLKEYAMTADKILNAGMQFDPVTLKPTYKLVLGYPGLSNAIDTAERLGILPEIIEKAKAIAGRNRKENYETVLNKANEIKLQAEIDLEKAESALKEANEKLEIIKADELIISEKINKINATAKQESKKIIIRLTDRANELIDEIKEKLANADEQSLIEARKKLRQIESLGDEIGEDYESVLYEPVSEEDIAEGLRVIIKSFGGEGSIVKYNPKKKIADVLYNEKVVSVKMDNLAKPVPRVSSNKASRTNIVYEDSPQIELLREINLIGETVDDAVAIIEPIINNARRMNLKGLRIVHGKGTGALGKGIQNYLKKSPLVKSFRYGKYGEGDNGVTIVELK